MKRNNRLDIILLTGFIYFTAVAVVHFLGVKIPMLYVYYDIPSNAYQDRIISVLCFAFAMFLFAGFKYNHKIPEMTNLIILAGFVAVVGLLVNNYIAGVSFRNNFIYWIEISMLALYLLLLIIFKMKNQDNLN